MRVIEICLPKDGRLSQEVERFYVLPEDYKAARIRICSRFVKCVNEIIVEPESKEANEAARNKIILTLKKRRK